MSIKSLKQSGFLIAGVWSIMVKVTMVIGNSGQDENIKPTKPIYWQPQQVHLSLGAQLDQIVVTWVTLDSVNSSVVEYGYQGSMNQKTDGKQTKFIDGGSLKRVLFIHRVYLSNLRPNTVYRYHCGSPRGWSEMFFFKTFPNASTWTPRFVIYGDLGNKGAETLGRLQEVVQSGEKDLVIHVGDFAYNLDTDNALVGDEFMRQIEPIAAYVPYQVLPGNHEHAYNFSNYVNRFSMHSQGDSNINNFFWSYNIGPVHVIAFCTEFHYFREYGTDQIMNQYRWLEEDLKQANKPENRAKHPWIVTFGHRPLYYRSKTDEMLRKGNQKEPGFEDLFYRYGVDLEFWGHEHAYMKFWPVYDNKIFNGSLEQPYTEPRAPVHITTGSAGCWMGKALINTNQTIGNLPQHALTDLDFGFTYLNVLNATHLQLQQISNDKNGAIIDEFYLIKTKHDYVHRLPLSSNSLITNRDQRNDQQNLLDLIRPFNLDFF